MDNGYWVKFESWRIEPNIQVPHGIRYSVTLHDRHNRRVLGFDNSHGFTPERKRFGARKTTWDHRHSGTRLRRTNSSRRVNCWKISGVKPSE